MTLLTFRTVDLRRHILGQQYLKYSDMFYFNYVNHSLDYKIKMNHFWTKSLIWGGNQLTNFLTDSVLIILQDLMNFRLTGYQNCIHGAKKFRMCGMEVCTL
jgi:hypothetical protein